MLTAAIRSAILASSGIQQILEDRVYLIVAPHGPNNPYCVYNLISDLAINDHETEGDGLSRARVQVDCYSDDVTEVTQLKRLLRTQLNAKSFNLNDTNILECVWEDCSSNYEDETSLYRVSIDLMILYQLT